MVEGVENGLVAGVAKIHHAAIDGVSGVEVTAQLMDLGPTPRSVEAPATPWRPESFPSVAALVADALADLFRLGPASLRAAASTAGAIRRVRARNRASDKQASPSPFRSPPTSLNGPLSGDRSMGMTHLDMTDVAAVRQATGATVNDVILAVTGAALREHLGDLGERPTRSLVAFVPVSVRQAGDTVDTGTNRLSGMLVTLATTQDDPVERLAAVSECARRAKDQVRDLGDDLFERMAAIAVPALLGPLARGMATAGLLRWRPPFNVVVSSFPGSPAPLYCAGAEMLAYHPFGPVVDGVGLNVTATTYRDQLEFGLLACRRAVPDAGALADRFPIAMTELVKALAV